MDLATASNPQTTPASATVAGGRRSVLVAVVLSWLLPGLGHLYMGRWAKALVMLVAIGGLYLGGLALTDYTCVDPEAYELEFVAHAFLGGPTAVVLNLTGGAELREYMPQFEVGRLYAAIAGLLNLVALCDVLGDVMARNRQELAQEQLRDRHEADRRAAREREAVAEALLEDAVRGEDPSACEEPFAPPQAGSGA